MGLSAIRAVLRPYMMDGTSGEQRLLTAMKHCNINIPERMPDTVVPVIKRGFDQS